MSEKEWIARSAAANGYVSWFLGHSPRAKPPKGLARTQEKRWEQAFGEAPRGLLKITVRDVAWLREVKKGICFASRS